MPQQRRTYADDFKGYRGSYGGAGNRKDVQPDMEDAPEFGLSEAEHKVLCLRDIAEIVWRLTGTGDAPIIYLNEAYRLCREYKKVSAVQIVALSGRADWSCSVPAAPRMLLWLRLKLCWRRKRLWKALILIVSTH